MTSSDDLPPDIGTPTSLKNLVAHLRAFYRVDQLIHAVQARQFDDAFEVATKDIVLCDIEKIAYALQGDDADEG